MGALRDPRFEVRSREPSEGPAGVPQESSAKTWELRDVPAVAVCAQCGDPSCPGHDFEQSGERPIHRLLAWEDGETPPLRALWRTAMTSATDLERWVRASRSTANGVGPALAFALGCELLAVVVTCGPLAAIAAFAVGRATHDGATVLAILALGARIAAVLLPTMIAIHVVHQLVIARAGGRLGTPISRTAVLRAGLYACGWDLATGPAGILAPLFRLDLAEAGRRLRGNRELYGRATAIWLHDVHGVEGDAVVAVRRATIPWMIALLTVACVGIAWAVAASFPG
jgi:hypothetical protein